MTQMDNHAKLEKILSNYKRWECSFFFNEANKNEKPRIVDLCDCLESGKDYLFPNRFFQLKSKKALVKELKLSSIRSGFPIDIRNSKVDHQCKAGVEHELYISCLAGIKYTKRDRKIKEKEDKSIAELNKKIDEEEKETIKKPNGKKKYVRKKKFNKTMSYMYTDESQKCPFAFTIQLVSSDFAQYAKHTERGRWKLKVMFKFFSSSFQNQIFM